MNSTRRYFESHTRSFDRVYTGRRAMRGGPARGRRLAASVVARHPGASVLDVGCGPGRVAEAVLDAGAGTYLGVDLSSGMLGLARERLSRFDGVELVAGDFLDLDLTRTFDVVLALGLFEYLPEPARAAEWLRRACAVELVASFTRWDLVKGPIRHLHYAGHGCRIVDYTEGRVEALLRAAGFSGIAFPYRGPRGFVATAA